MLTVASLIEVHNAGNDECGSVSRSRDLNHDLAHRLTSVQHSAKRHKRRLIEEALRLNFALTRLLVHSARDGEDGEQSPENELGETAAAEERTQGVDAVAHELAVAGHALQAVHLVLALRSQK